jgi:hypothetical protein
MTQKATSEKAPTEHLEQVQFIQWFRQAYPQFFIFAIPNGEYRAMTVAKRLKAEGVVSGVPDLLALLPNAGALFIEMKRQKGGTLSANQKEVIERIKSLGFDVLVCKGALDAKNQIEGYMNELPR